MRDDIKQIFDAVLAAMQPADELGGPETHYDYVVLMTRIAREAQDRAHNATEFASRGAVSVAMRPPNKGERGWWVAARDASSAFAEVRRESEEMGWIAECDYSGDPDGDGMIAVTITIGDGS